MNTPILTSLVHYHVSTIPFVRSAHNRNCLPPGANFSQKNKLPESSSLNSYENDFLMKLMRLLTRNVMVVTLNINSLMVNFISAMPSVWKVLEKLAENLTVHIKCESGSMTRILFGDFWNQIQQFRTISTFLKSIDWFMTPPLACSSNLPEN